MNNRLVCLEGTVDFAEDIRTQSINIVSFSQGQQITINRDRLPEGRSFAEQMSQQIDNAQKVFNQFSFIKMDELNDGDLFAETIQIVFTFVSGNGQRLWQVTFSSRLTEHDIINFISVYPDEASMEREIGRLKHCVKHFVLNNS